MEILDRVFQPHTSNLERSLDRATRRMGLLNANLANVNTPGYKRRDIDFGIELQSAESRLADRRGADEARIDGGSIRIDGSSVDLEREVVAIAETQFRYQVLTEMANRYFSGLRNVIREGR